MCILCIFFQTFAYFVVCSAYFLKLDHINCDYYISQSHLVLTSASQAFIECLDGWRSRLLENVFRLARFFHHFLKHTFILPILPRFYFRRSFPWKIMTKIILSKCSCSSIRMCNQINKKIIRLILSNIFSPYKKSFKINVFTYIISRFYFRFLQICRETGTPLKTRQLVEFGLQVSRGLSHLHSLGVLHRDISTRTCV